MTLYLIFCCAFILLVWGALVPFRAGLLYNGTVYCMAVGGYFAAFAITLFLAQCVNFPMQRNITFKSKGNIWYQILWYVIAFVLITIVCSFLMGLYVPLCKQFFSPAVYNVLITVINGGVQMVIYFPIYKIIFPEGEAK